MPRLPKRQVKVHTDKIVIDEFERLNRMHGLSNQDTLRRLVELYIQKRGLRRAVRELRPIQPARKEASLCLESTT